MAYRVYHRSACEDAEHIVSRHRILGRAVDARDRADRQLAECHPGGGLLCGYAVQEQVDGAWVDVDCYRDEMGDIVESY